MFLIACELHMIKWNKPNASVNDEAAWVSPHLESFATNTELPRFPENKTVAKKL